MINKYCIANWKMNFNIIKSQEFIREINKKNLSDIGKKIILCPSFVSLLPAIKYNVNSLISIGAQNLYYQDSGSFTGEISASMLNEIGVSYTILGHSERRHIFGEKDEIIFKKVVQSLKYGITPIVCIGEKLVDRESGNTNHILRKQIKEGLLGVEGEFILAYEPVWAIGTGRSATLEMITETHSSIKSILNDFQIDQCISLLYGGSVTPDNSSLISEVPNVDGFLIGGCSLDIEKFYSIYLNL